MTPFIWCPEKANSQSQKVNLKLPRAEEWEWGVATNGHKRSSGGDRNVPKQDYGDGCTSP